MTLVQIIKYQDDIKLIKAAKGVAYLSIEIVPWT